MNISQNPFACLNFQVEVDGIVMGAFAECSGLTEDTDSTDYREQSISETLRKIPGARKFSKITLKRGLITNFEFYQWLNKTANSNNEVVKKSVTVVLLGESRNLVFRWNFKNAWPTKLEGDLPNTTDSVVVIETLELAHEGFEMESPKENELDI